jgi:hypothetical protein
MKHCKRHTWRASLFSLFYSAAMAPLPDAEASCFYTELPGLGRKESLLSSTGTLAISTGFIDNLGLLRECMYFMGRKNGILYGDITNALRESVLLNALHRWTGRTARTRPAFFLARERLRPADTTLRMCRCRI